MASSSNVRPPIFDSMLVSTPADLSGVQQTYTKASYEKIPLTNGQPQNWTAGSVVGFTTPSFSDSVWDGAETYINLRGKVHATFYHTTTGAVLQDIPLSGYSTAAVEKYFLSGLCEQISLNYGDSEIKSFEGPPHLFPALHAMYTTLNVPNDKVIGEAQCLNLAPTPDPLQTVQAVKTSFFDDREWFLTRDACEPFNICQSADLDNLPGNRNAASTDVPFDVQLTVAPYSLYRAHMSNPGHQYRSSLILDSANTANPVGPPAVVNSLHVDSSHEWSMKFYHPFFDKNKDGFKIPANLSLRIDLRRARDISYTLMGDALTDVILSTGALVPQTGPGATSCTYRLVIDQMDLYMKRLVLSETARTVLYQTPSIVWEQPIYTANDYTMTSRVITQPVANVKTPELVLVAMMPKDSLRPPALAPGGNFKKFTSVYNTSPRGQIAFRSIYLNTSKGIIPEVRYEPCYDNLSLNTAQSMRAYREFKKAFKNPEECPIPFKLWVNNYQWYAFLINNDQESPHDETNLSERSNIVVNAVVEPINDAELANHSLVVITMESGLVLDDNMKSVSVLY